ncbi:MAG: hypothetical protein BWX90_00115 [bacterium ADurb.Bin132]|nr:MAG: hypothetical protein BWX90_00115 [bacterium ADurb.Bin132]
MNVPSNDCLADIIAKFFELEGADDDVFVGRGKWDYRANTKEIRCGKKVCVEKVGLDGFTVKNDLAEINGLL